MKSWTRIALASGVGKTLMIGLALAPWEYFSDSAMQSESEKQTRIMENDEKSVTLTEENFQSEIPLKAKPAGVDFWKGWYGPRPVTAPMVEEGALKLEDLAEGGRLDLGLSVPKIGKAE